MTTIYYAYADPTEDGDRIVTEAEAEAIRAEDPGLIVEYTIEAGVLTASDRPGRCTCCPGETCLVCRGLPMLVVEALTG